MKRIFLGLALFVGVVTLMTVGNTAGMAGVVAKRFDPIPSAFTSEEIAVKFLEGAAVETPEKLLPADLQTKVEKISPQFSIKKDNLKSLKSRGEYLSGEKIPNLSLWYKIKLKGEESCLNHGKTPSVQREMKGSATTVGFLADKVFPLVYCFPQLRKAAHVLMHGSHTEWAQLEKFHVRPRIASSEVL
jgi:hypothetical protein